MTMLCEKYRQFLHWNLYQIYPRSFMDSNHDGIGDLRGVLQKLDYLKDLGINAIWLCPCFKSPNDDNGYDISDYRDIMDEFGTLEDMKALIAGLHQRDMKLILDLVPNHTSTAHKWFQESRKGKDNPYSDFYYWFDSPPNDWESMFRGSAWEYDEMRGQYYLHSFAVSQADLNWDNPAVVKAMQDVVDYWVDMGVDGFRIDVIDMISKDIPNGKICFGPHLHEYIHALFGREKTAHLFTVGESWVEDIDELIRHCDASRSELSTLFLFDHMQCGRSDKFTPKPDSLKTLRDCLIHWQEATAAHDLLHTLFLENHDQPPLISRIGNDRERRYESATCIAAMYALLHGIPLIYQGQEWGTPSAHYDSIEDFDDIESINYYKEMLAEMSPEEALKKINFGSRDNSRRPLSWDGTDGAGFTDAKPWIPFHSRQKDINLAKDLASEHSIFRFYRDLLRLRAEEIALTEGEFRVVSKPEDDFFAYTRTKGDTKILVVCNFETPQVLHFSEAGTVLLANLNRTEISGNYQSYECAVFRLD